MIDNNITAMKYIKNTIICEIVKLLKSLCSVPCITVKQASNGNDLHIISNTPPITSLGKYIQLVKHTN